MPSIPVEMTTQYRATLKVALANPELSESELATLAKISTRTIRRYRGRKAWRAALDTERDRRAEAEPDEFRERAAKAIKRRKNKREATGEKFDFDQAADEALEVCADIVAAGPGAVDPRIWTACLNAIVKMRTISKTAELRDSVGEDIGTGDFRLIELKGEEPAAA